MEDLKIPPKDTKLLLHQNAIRLFRLPVGTSVFGGELPCGRL